MRYRYLALICLLLLPGATLARRTPGLGAVAAPLIIDVPVGNPPVHYRFAGTLTFTPKGTEAVRTVTGTGTWVLVGPTPPPPPGPAVTGVSPNPVQSGALFTITGTGFDTSTVVTYQGLKVVLQSLTATALTVVAPVVSADTSGALVVSTAAGSVTGPVLSVRVGVVPPPPLHTISVKSFGAVGDDRVDDTAACQHAISAAKAGDTIFFPAGTYKISDWLKFGHPPIITVMGEGPTSVIHSVAGGGLMIGTGGESGGPVTVTKLNLTGNAGATMHSTIQPSGGVQIYGPQNTVVDNCDFADVTTAVYEADPSKGMTVRNCRLNGWARIGFFLGGNDTIIGCTAIQTDPSLNGQQTSHGLYCHASNVLVQDCIFQNCRKYGLQIYSEEIGRVMDNVRLIHDTFLNCHDGGITLDHSQMGAGDIHNALIQDCTIRGTYGGAGLAIKNGDGVTVKDCVIDGSPSYGLAMGVFAPYNVGFAVQNVTVTGCTISHCQTGLITYPSNGGTLSNILFQGNKITGNSRNIDQQGSTSGIKILP